MRFIQKHIVVFAWLFLLFNSLIFVYWFIFLEFSAAYSPWSPLAPFYFPGVLFSFAVILVSFILAIRITTLRKSGNRVSQSKWLVYFHSGVLTVPVMYFISLAIYQVI